MTPRVLGLGVATPAERLDAERSAELLRVLSATPEAGAAIALLHRRTGIRERGFGVLDPGGGLPRLYRPDAPPPTTAARLAAYTEIATELATTAAREALDDAGVEPAAITHLVTVSCTGFEAPGFDLALVRALGLPANVARTHVGFMGCHGAVNGLRVAAALAARDATARVLVCCAEVCSLHLHHSTRRDQLIANALFADGAGAAIVGGAPDAAGLEIAATAGRIFDGCADEMSWRIGDHGFEMTLAATVPERLRRVVPAWVDEVLAAEGLDRDAIGGWALHPGGPRVIGELAGGLGLDERATRPALDVLAAHGNMSSATILFILRGLRDAGTPRPWLALAFGPGLAGEALLLR